MRFGLNFQFLIKGYQEDEEVGEEIDEEAFNSSLKDTRLQSNRKDRESHLSIPH